MIEFICYMWIMLIYILIEQKIAEIIEKFIFVGSGIPGSTFHIERRLSLGDTAVTKTK